MRHRRSRVRPFVLATVAISALLAGLGIARQDQSNYGLPVEQMDTGRIWVEGTVAPLVGGSPSAARPLPVPKVAPAPAPAALKKEAPISFYNTVGNGGAPVKMNPATPARDRSKLPVPPPRQEVKVAAIAPEVSQSKPATAGQKADQSTKANQSTKPNTSANVAKANSKARVAAAVVDSGSADNISRVQAESAAIVESLKKTTEDAGEVSSVPLPYTLQVASFSTQEGADELVDRLQSKDQPAYLASATIPGKGTWWRVRVGRYPTHAAAKWARLDLIRLGVEPMVIRDDAGAKKKP